MRDSPLIVHLLLSCLFFLLLLPQIGKALLRQPHVCLDDQKSSLLQLQKESFKTSSFSLWEPETDCCSWEGVTCNMTTGYVIGLDLMSFNLSGRIYSSSSLFDLNHLQRLNLAYGDFMLTPIPSGFGRLSSLTHLNLSNTCFSGQIPWDFSRLTRLVSLDLSTYYYDFCTPSLRLERPSLKELIQNLTSLMELYLDGVDLSTQGSDWSQVLPQALPNLRALSFSHCGLSGPIHSSLSQLVILSELQLDENYLFVEAPKFLANFSHLKILSLRSCGLYGEFPSSVFQLPNLQILDVSNNSLLTGQLPDFPHSNALEFMSLSETKFSGRIPDSIGNLRFLTKLRLFDCNFVGSVSPSLANLTQLTELDLSWNAFTGSIPSSLANLTQLSLLGLSFNSFTGSIPLFESISQLSILEYLFLGSNNFSGNVKLDMFGNLENLKMLDLSDNLLSLEANNSSSSLPQFEVLCLRSCHIKEFPNFLRTQDKLQCLDLSNNNLSGSIPESICKLRSLQNFLAANNNLSGSIPECLGNSGTLSVLYVPGNRFHGLPQHFTSACSLRRLQIKGNILEGQVPRSLANCTSLEYLDLGENKMFDTFSFWLGKLPMLLGLILRSNRFYGPIKQAQTSNEFPMLPRMDLSSNSFIGNLSAEHFQSWREMMLKARHKSEPVSIADLNPSNNRFQGESPEVIVDLTSLTVQNLPHNDLTGQIPSLFRNMSHLVFLDISGNKLTGSMPIPSSSIQFFLISNNSFNGGIPESICKLDSLEIFDASYNNLSGSIPECLGNIDTLSVSDVQGNRFQGIPQHFANASSLRTLKINGNILEGKVPRSLANCTSLNVLDLGKNKISDTFPYWLGKLPMLRVLILHSNRFYGPIEQPRTFNEFPMLQIMDLSSNRFTGNLPSGYFRSFKAMMSENKNKSEPNYIGDTGGYYTDSVIIMNKGQEMKLVKILTIYTALDLSNNGFQGEIPEVIGDLRSLIVLNLSHNHLTGQIPSLIANMAELESLDFSRNKLSGQIPRQLAYLTFLEFLNFSQNLLEGPIPRGNQLETFSNTSYNENPRLCGFPLSRKCKDDSDDMLPQPPGEKSMSTNYDLKFDWKFMLMGYGSGMVIGIVMGHVIFKDEWLIRTFRMAPTGRRRKSKNGRIRRG